MHFKKSILLCFLLLTPFFAFAEETIGKKDESIGSHLLFLQDTTVLLKKGDQRFGVAFSMTNDEQRILSTTVSQEIFSLVFSYSLGIGYGAEIFVSLPANYTKAKKSDFIFNLDEEKASSGFGNAVLGIKKTLLVQNADRPELVGFVSLSSPLNSSSKSYPTDTTTAVELTAIKSIEPVVLYGGISYTHPFGDDSSSFGLRFGSAFAVNHKIAFGGEFSMSKMSENNTSLSSISVLTLRETYSASKNFSVEPSLSFGLSDSAPDMALRISASWNY